MTDPRYVLGALSPHLTPKQQVALVRVIEECSEIQKAAAKALRFGLRIADVTGNGKQYDNLADIQTEFEDLSGVIEGLLEIMR